ncbi:Ubiquitin-protein ligase Sel1/Ubx2 [Penicillium sp. DV-2018c]|nr:Ubiquitin-protein ligase Sel1/Ubx2 [Penicillium sp. DV-2018c]
MIEPRPRRTFSEWVKTFIENDEESYYEDLYDQQRGDDDEYRGLESESHEDGYYDDLDLDIDEGMLEGLLIVGLAAALLVMVYFRQQQQLRNRQNENANANGNANPQDGNRNANDRGFFPQPGDPEFGQWVAGGVGH